MSLHCYSVITTKKTQIIENWENVAFDRHIFGLSSNNLFSSRSLKKNHVLKNCLSAEQYIIVWWKTKQSLDPVYATKEDKQR